MSEEITKIKKMFSDNWFLTALVILSALFSSVAYQAVLNIGSDLDALKTQFSLLNETVTKYDSKIDSLSADLRVQTTDPMTGQPVDVPIKYAMIKMDQNNLAGFQGLESAIKNACK